MGGGGLPLSHELREPCAALALAHGVLIFSNIGREKSSLHWEDTWPHDSVRTEAEVLCFWRD